MTECELPMEAMSGDGEFRLPTSSPIFGAGGQKSLNERLRGLRQQLGQHAELSGIGRIALAVHDPVTDLVRTFAHSSDWDTPLEHYAAALASVPSLQRLIERRCLRVVDDVLAPSVQAHQRHSRVIKASGYRSSFTLPMFQEGEFYGFIFLNSRQPAYFRGERLHQVLPYAGLVSLLGVNTLRSARMFLGAARTALALSSVRDHETGAHQQRVADYSRLIALQLAPARQLRDEYIEMVFQFAPLHDIGKIGIADAILRKPGRLTAEEYDAMKRHVAIGNGLVETMVAELGLRGSENADVLRNVVAGHHEAWDGSGYPQGRRGEEISLEGRILAVADVFDALTSERPYKQPWSNERAFAYLREKAGTQFDPECVRAFLDRVPEVLEIQQLHA